MSELTTGVTKEEAIKAIQTIVESAHVLLGYHNTFAFDTVSRKLRGRDKDTNVSELGRDIVELLGEGSSELGNHPEQINSLIDIRSNVVELIDNAKHILKLLEDVTYLQNNP